MGSSDLIPSGGDAILPLSLSQREVWIDQLAWPGSTHLNIGGALDFFGPIDSKRMQFALDAMVQENEALRLVPLQDGTQKLLHRHHADIDLIDFSHEHDPKPAMLNWEREWIKKPFRFEDGPPWRFALIKGGGEHYYIIIQFHHVIMDGWGTSMIASRLSEHYNAITEGRLPETPQALVYRNFIEESLEYRNSQTYLRDGEFWREQIHSVPEPLFDRRYAWHDPQILPDAHLAKHRIGRTEYDEVIRLATETGTTAFHWFMASVAVYFAKTLNRAEVVIGVPSLNRSGKRYKATMGMFVGVLPLLVKVDPLMTAGELIESIAAQLRSAYRHPKYPLSELGRMLNVIRQGRDSLFDLLVSYERQDYSCSFAGVKGVGSHQTFSGKARYPLGLTICEFSQFEDVELVLEGSSIFFESVEMDMLGPRLGHMLTAMRENPQCPVKDLPVMPPEELWGVIEGVQIDSAEHGPAVPFIRLFEHQVKRNPDATALVWQEGMLVWQDGVMSFSELDREANNFAVQLRDAGVKKGDVVALLLSRGPQMVIAVLATAKAGAAFLPLDPEAPVGRIAAILDDCKAKAVFVDETTKERFFELALPKVYCRLSQSDEQQADVANETVSMSVNLSQEDAAYVLFTSGSTGKPKGVKVGHGALSRRLDWIGRSWKITEHDRSALSTQLTFDPSLIELLVPLIHGASVALPPPGRLLPESLASFVVEKSVTMMAFVPSTLQRFLDGLAGRNDCKLRVVCSGGEVLAPELAERFARETNAQLYNVYGPTEATIFATAWLCGSKRETLALPVGSPLDDTRIYIFDNDMNVLPFGVAGEVCIGGDALADGYINRPELDASLFLPDPFVPGKRMYRTGDRGWLDPDGQLHFSGRIDRQVKLRGYRIELGEIESALLSIEGVTLSAAKKVEKEGKQAIHAWISSSRPLSSDFLNKQLSLRLPDYMLPSRYSVQAELPIKGTGKIDYDALPEISEAVPTHRFRQPSGEMERQLLEIWREALQRNHLGVSDNFFDAGGDSLAAISILSGIEKTLGIKLALHHLIESPTVASLAEVLSEQLGLPSLMVSLGTTSRGATLYLAASGHGDLLRFRSLAKAMEGACDLHMLQPPGYATESGLADLATLYSDRIEAKGDREVFVAGFSVGGLAALETARQLQQRGVNVRGLFLVDTVLAKLPKVGFSIWKFLAWIVRHIHVLDFNVNGRRLATTLNDTGLIAQVRAMNAYQPKPFVGNVLLIKSSGLIHWDRWLFSPWRRLIPDIKEQVMQGLHGTMFEPGKIETLAKILADHVHLDDSSR